MRQCIFCGQLKKDSEFNKEHIILDSLGGKGSEDICKNVCKSCNSSLGTRVDACLVNHGITKYLRYSLKIRGRNGVPNPFKNVKVNYDNTIFTGELQTDSRGNLTGFRADYRTYEVGSKIIISGPKRGFARYVNSQLKRKNLPVLSEADIHKNTLHIKNPKVPHLDKEIIFQESETTNYLYFAYPAMLKMAYEFCFIKLGEHYLDDSLAIDIREFLMEFDYKKCSEYFSPTNAKLEWNDKQTRVVSLEIYRKCNELYVKVDLYGQIAGTFCMSKSADKYREVKANTLHIET